MIQYCKESNENKKSKDKRKRGGCIMELAKITSKGQITIPKSIRDKLGVSNGDKVLFYEVDGKIILTNAMMLNLEKAQASMVGVAENIGVRDENDVVKMVKAIRKENNRVK